SSYTAEPAMQVFISHSHDHEDAPAYSGLCRALDRHSIPWCDISKFINVGELLSERLVEAIEKCQLCVFIATRKSVISQWCLAELGAFWGTRKPVLLYLTDPGLHTSNLPQQFQVYKF